MHRVAQDPRARCSRSPTRPASSSSRAFLADARRRDPLDRRHRQGAARRRHRGDRGRGPTPASPRSWTAGSRRCTRRSTAASSRAATMPRTRKAMADHGIAADRSRRRQPLSLRGDGREGRRAATTCVENIDIGGPAMIRAAAKNHDYVTVVTDPADYAARAGRDGRARRRDARSRFARRLAAKAFARTAAYDAAIAALVRRPSRASPSRAASPSAGDRWPDCCATARTRTSRPRSTSTADPRPGVATARQLQGKELSYNNINDTDAAFELVAEFAGARRRDHQARQSLRRRASAATLARGLAARARLRSGERLRRHRRGQPAARRRDRRADRQALHRGGRSRPRSSADARDPARRQEEPAPARRPAACPTRPRPGRRCSSLAGGFLVQDRDNGRVTARRPQGRDQARADASASSPTCLFAFTRRQAREVERHRLCQGRRHGRHRRRPDEPRRFRAHRRPEGARGGARPRQAQTPRTRARSVASDAFFPFADGLLAAAEAGATAVIQPGGSMRDDEVIAAADEAGLAMVFTGMRHFRH